MMATFTAINCKRQTSGAMCGTLDYVPQKKKTRWAALSHAFRSFPSFSLTLALYLFPLLLDSSAFLKHRNIPDGKTIRDIFAFRTL